MIKFIRGKSYPEWKRVMIWKFIAPSHMRIHLLFPPPLKIST